MTTLAFHRDASAPESDLRLSDLSYRLLPEHRATVVAMLGGAARSLVPGRRRASSPPVLRETVRAPSADLRRAYARWCGAGSRYASTTPPHLVCAKVTLPIVSRLTAMAPYPLLSVLNQGLRLQVHRPVPIDEPIHLEGRLVDASDDGYRARIHSRVVVGTASAPRAMTIDAMAAVVLATRRDERRDESRVGPEFETVGRWRARASEGQTFFFLTGDFNPIHTVPSFARRTRFGGCIMHGYGAFAQIHESLARRGADFDDIDVRFVRPLPLPSPTLTIERAIAPDDEGRVAIRLVDDAGTIYQAGHYVPKAKGR